MSGVRRFLSRREKSPVPGGASRHGTQRSHAQTQRIEHFGGAFSVPDDAPKKADKEEEKNIKAIMERFRYYGIDNLDESNVLYALRACTPANDPQAAFQLLMLLEDTYEGIVKPYNPGTKMKGAVNRQGVSCYLDALLFAMFARLDSFEAMLYNHFDDPKRKRLAGLLRLWVNVLRAGKLITTDITEHLQRSMADLGWLDASRTIQQDPSEAFSFITGHLELPMLTLKMDMFHTGKEDPQDDHKFVNERLLEVALLDAPPEGNAVITLEDCLEQYFNNRIEIKRHLENQRRNTLRSINSAYSVTKDKEFGAHVEVTDLGDSADTPTVSTPIVEITVTESPLQGRALTDKFRPSGGRRRTDSIFSQRRIQLTTGGDLEHSKSADASSPLEARLRKMSTKTEVLMPAWQFFKLLPWYVHNMPESDAQVAAHFSKKRPVLGICLKRYSYTNEGEARKLDTYVDIPLEIAVPNFVGDDSMDDEGPLSGSFRLMLQSVVCHRGVSVHSGHYISLCRGQTPAVQSNSSGDEQRNNDGLEDTDDPWMRFDDLAAERITSVNVREALKQETPYLLFYQVVPIDDGETSAHGLPSYAEATSRSTSTTTVEKPYLNEMPGSESTQAHNTADIPTTTYRASTEVLDFALPSESRRASVDTSAFLDQPRGRINTNVNDGRRLSVPFESIGCSENNGFTGTLLDPTSSSLPTTPAEEKAAAATVINSTFANVANKLAIARRGSRNSHGQSSNASTTSKSRPHSAGPADWNNPFSNRFTLSMTKLTQKVSRSDAPLETETAVVDATEEEASAAGSVDSSTSAGVPPRGLAPTAPVSQQRIPITTSSPANTRPLRRDKAVPRSEKRPSKSGEDRDCVVM